MTNALLDQVAFGFGGVALGAVLTTALTYYLSERQRKESQAEAVASLTSTVSSEIENLLHYLARYEDKLRPLIVDNWDKDMPANGNEILLRVKAALEVFPLPVATKERGWSNIPLGQFFQAVSDELRASVVEVNELVSRIRASQKPSRELVAQFISRAQIVISSSSLIEFAGGLFEGYIDMLATLLDSRISKKKREKLVGNLTNNLRNLYESFKKKERISFEYILKLNKLLSDIGYPA